MINQKAGWPAHPRCKENGLVQSVCVGLESSTCCGRAACCTSMQALALTVWACDSRLLLFLPALMTPFVPGIVHAASAPDLSQSC